MRRWDRFMASAARHPGAFTWGMREFRSWVTRAYDDDDQRQAYDVGRELAHMATLRRFDGRQ